MRVKAPLFQASSLFRSACSSATRTFSDVGGCSSWATRGQDLRVAHEVGVRANCCCPRRGEYVARKRALPDLNEGTKPEEGHTQWKDIQKLGDSLAY